MPSVHNSPNVSQTHLPIVDSAEVGHTSGGESSTAVALHPGQGPLSRRLSENLEHNRAELIELASRSNSPVQDEPQVETQASAALVAQRDELLRLRQDDTATPLDKLSAQFQLEGIALRDILDDAATVRRIASGELTREVVSEESPVAHSDLPDRANLYDAVNTGAPGSVAMPFSDAELAAAGVHVTQGAEESADAFAARRTAEMQTQRLCLTHTAYEHAILQLQGNPAALENVKLAHEAFKVGIASKHSELEFAQMTLQVNVDVAKNKMLLLKSAANRTSQLATLQPQLAAAKAELAAHARASDYILHYEHLVDHKRRSISSEDGVLSWVNKVGQQAYVSGVPQAIASLLSWGYGRNLGAKLADFIAGDQTGAWPMVLSTVCEAAALAASHEIVTNGPKDMIQAFTELGGWARPPEPSNANQLYPDARTSDLSATGEIIVIDATDAQATVDAARAALKKQAATNTFGNVSGDFKGESSFAGANLTRDVATSAGFEGASSIHGRSVTSAGGGLTMSTLHSVGQLGKQVNGVPTHVTPLRQNPRTVVQRLETGLQKFDLTQEANRLNFPSKFTSAFTGILGANAMGELFSEPVHAKQLDAKDPGVEAAWAILHAFIEGSKSYATLGPFFSGLAAAGDAKKVPGTSNASVKRAFVGWQALSHPASGANTSAYVPGTHGYRRQVLNNVVKGSSQLLAQPVAVALEKTATGGVKVTAAGVKKIMPSRTRTQPEPDSAV